MELEYFISELFINVGEKGTIVHAYIVKSILAEYTKEPDDEKEKVG